MCLLAHYCSSLPIIASVTLMTRSDIGFINQSCQYQLPITLQNVLLVRIRIGKLPVMELSVSADVCCSVSVIGVSAKVRMCNFTNCH